jgi:hypothetical protein
VILAQPTTAGARNSRYQLNVFDDAFFRLNSGKDFWVSCFDEVVIVIHGGQDLNPCRLSDGNKGLPRRTAGHQANKASALPSGVPRR